MWVFVDCVGIEGVLCDGGGFVVYEWGDGCDV